MQQCSKSCNTANTVFTIALLLFLLLSVIAIYDYRRDSRTEQTAMMNTTSITLQTQKGDVTFFVELATTEEQWKKGLMGRTSLAPDAGMLFVFPTDLPVVFWMKNTTIPLDLVYINSNGSVSQIWENAQPCKAEPCDLYPANPPAQYILEVNAHVAAERGIAIGDRISAANT